MSSQVPFMALDPAALAKLQESELGAFTRAAQQIANGEQPTLSDSAELVLTIQRLIASPS